MKLGCKLNIYDDMMCVLSIKKRSWASKIGRQLSNNEELQHVIILKHGEFWLGDVQPLKKKPAAGNQRQNPPGQNLSIPIQSPKQYKNWSFAATIHPVFLKNVPSGNSINYFVHSYGNWPMFFHKHKYDLPIKHYDFPVCYVSQS